MTSSRLTKEAIQTHLDSRCKPPGSLGELERLAHDLCRIQNSVHPLVTPRRVVIFAADHGVVAQGVSAWPSSVTAAVVGVMTKGRSASGVFARTFGCDYQVVDVGCVQSPQGASENDEYHGVRYLSRPVACGTADLATGPAMTRTQFHAAWRIGKELADRAADEGMRVVAPGEMGIGNTTSAACLVTLLAGVPVMESVGRGAGIDDPSLEVKRQVVKQATTRAHRLASQEDWKGVACEVAGFEIVAMSGFLLRSAQRGLTIVLDGYIATAAALLAERLSPGVARHMLAAHRSSEPGHAKALEALDLKPFLDWGLRLGEGTGALLLMPMLDAAVAMTNDMASLDEVAPPHDETP